MDLLVGYNGLIANYGLSCRPDRTTSRISSRPKVKEIKEQVDDTVAIRYPHQFSFENRLHKHLEFCLKYEGLNLEVLEALFTKTGPQPYVDWLTQSPTSAYARRTAWLFEWATGTSLPVSNVTGGAYVDAAPRDRYYLPKGTRVPRFRVINNMPGTRNFLPMARRTPVIEGYLARNLGGQIDSVIRAIDPQTLARAVDYMYLSETKSSYGIEKETPSPERAARFRQLLEAAGQAVPLTEEQFTEWQNEAMEPARREPGYRVRQNWLGRGGLKNFRRADYLPPAPADVHALMEGLKEFCSLAEGQMDPVIAAACAAYGFVFIHPFMDGNGRLHRFLLHHLLRLYRFTPPGTLVPVSAAMYADVSAYAAVLKRFSASVMSLLSYHIEEGGKGIRVTTEQPKRLYAFFDATPLVEYTFSVIELAIMRDLPHEVAYLQAYDLAYRNIDEKLDMPHEEIDLYIKVATDNGGKLSKSKRKSHFAVLSDVQVSTLDAIIADAFAPLLREGKSAVD